MNKQNTVFVLGAGASEHYGYPTGEKLRSNIITYFEGWYDKHISQPNSPFPRQNVYTIERLITPRLIRDFIKDFDDSGAQIDIFISRNSDYTEYTHLGKLAIILAIIESEWKSSFPNDDMDWYRELFTQLTEGRTKPDDFRISENENNVSFITFNYDRSLEHYLHHTLQKNFLSAKPSDITKEINSIPIIHVYGVPALLEWQDNPTGIHTLSYNINKKIPLDKEAWQYVENIFVMHDERDNPNVEESKKLLRQANRIYFLGFGYLKYNVEILDIPSTIGGATRIYGTAYKFSDQRVRNITRDYFSPIRPDRLKIEKDMKCNDLIFNYPLSTN